ncbi:SpoIIE family protein phosphatase [Marinoscillum sp. MHG1-6]|uniref:SpoIIE family protein phosphatase n=1 Tax=Marinoscillum sp. MHG1-6 TaxID=2959627 RepID=UPI0021588C2C|nr:SpoIIE family protein phosphatase [Marinoscillum sp. MHG1-6]
MNIYAKLTLLCLFLVVVSSSVIFVFTNLKVKKTYSEEILISVTKQAESTISNIEQFIFSRINDVRMATKNPYFRIGDISSEELTSRLQELENLNDLYYNFTFYNMEGVRVADSKRQSVGKSDTTNLLWKKLSPETPSTMAVSISPELDRVIMQFGATVNDLFDQNPSGVLVGSILLDELFKIMGDISLSGDSTVRLNVNLIDQNGLILYSNDPSSTPLKSAFNDFDLIKDAKGSSRVNVVETDNDLYFVAHQQSYLNYEGNDWILCVSTDKESVNAPLKDVQSQILLIILAVLGASLILALVAANLFVRPIVKLSEYAEEIGSGNLNVKIDITGNDEIGKLGKLLATSSKSLMDRIHEQKESNQKLEQQKAEIEKQKHLLENVNQQISDSIIYAQRIQNAILPDLNSISKLVNDAFVIFKPKDVVSGDFYWFERIRQGRSEYLVIACADCTGHGVPGAIMSIMGSNQLTNIIYYQNYLDPNKILARLDKLIKMELQRDNEENRDGMEIGICVINLDDLKMEFSGAGIPLYLVRNNELTTYRSPKVMIGGIEGDEREAAAVINKEEIQLSEGDRLFLASDGFQDQFGGPQDKKFMGKNLKALIQESSVSLSDKKVALEEAFDKWKQNTPQTDDVLVLGIEI